MGGGNGCKSAAKREKNQAKAAIEAKKKAGPPKAQPMRICKRCFTQFPYTTKEPLLRVHCQDKHPDFTFETSFPDYGKEEEKKN